MKLILAQEVPGLGSAGEAVEVKDGYGRNYLVPRGYAIPWTKGGQKQIDAIRLGREKRAIDDLETARSVKERLEATEVSLSAKAASGGRLFGSVTPAEIARAIASSGGPEVDKRRIEVGRPIKTVGAHSVVVRLHPEVAATVDVEIVAS